MMKTRWILIATIALATVGGGPRGELASAHAGKDGRSRKAKAIERHLWLAEYYVLRARDLAGASREYQAVLKLDKGHTGAALALADVLVADKKAKQAIEMLRKAAVKAKGDPVLWRALGRLLAQAGDAAAGEALRKGTGPAGHDPDGLALLLDWLDARYRGGDKAVAKELADAAAAYLRVAVPRAGAAYERAERVTIELGGDPLALTIFDARKAFDAAFDVASFGEINRKMAEARRGFAACVDREPGREECHYYLGLIHGSVKASEDYDPKRARAELEKAPGLALAWLERGRLDRNEDRLKEARAAFARALALDGRLGAAHLEDAIVAKLMGDEAGAVAALERTIDLDRLAPAASKALGELAKIQPSHRMVREGLMYGSLGSDVFSTEKYKGAVQMIEDQLGGVDDAAPEKAVVEEIVAKLVTASEAGSKYTFKVGVLKSGMVNAFALPDGSIYVTRGMFDLLKRRWPKRPIDARNDVLGHVLAHEVTHVVRRHTVQSMIYQEAVKDASRWSDPSVLTHVTRIHEIEADREGIVMAFLAGFHPRGGIEFMEVSGQEMEIPAHLDHPTFDERVAYLSDYWTNDVRYAFVSFGLGVKAMDRATAAESTDVGKAATAYQEAADHFRRFRAGLSGTRDVLNNLGVAYAKLGVLAQAEAGSPLSRWQTRFSLERAASIQYAGLARDGEGAATTRGGGKARLPWQLREAIAILKEARALDPGYARAGFNLAAAYLAAGKWKEAGGVLDELGRAKADAGELALLRGVAQAEQARWDDAIASFDAAAAVRATGQAGAFNRARALAMAGKRAEAKTAFQAYLKHHGKGPWAAAARAELGKL